MSTFDIILEFINEKIWLAVFIFILFFRSCPRKKYFGVKIAGGLLGVLVFGLLPKFLAIQFPTSVALNFLLEPRLRSWPIILALYMGIMFRCNWNMKLLSAIAGLCAQETMFGLWALISVTIPAVDTNIGELLLGTVVGVCVAVGLYYFLAVKITPRNLQLLQQRSLVPLLALYILAALLVSYSTTVVLFLVLFFDVLRGALAETGLGSWLEEARMASVFSNIAGNVVILLALRNMLRYSESDLERQVLEQIREQDRKQFTHFRNNVDYINAKSHDLKHYLDLIQSNKTIPQKELEEVSESILRLDSETDSGNETLDMILTDRRLVCAREGIELIFQTDGTKLEQLDMIDTFGVFCNILDNAIGYVKGLPPEDRSIRLGIRTIRGMVFIHQENPLNGTLDMKDGLPVTTQTDPTRHGFGLKSVQNTVKKRGGEFAIWAENGRFELDICFPQETIQE